MLTLLGSKHDHFSFTTWPASLNTLAGNPKCLLLLPSRGRRSGHRCQLLITCGCSTEHAYMSTCGLLSR